MRLASVLPLLLCCGTPAPQAAPCDLATCAPRCEASGLRIADRDAGSPADATLSDAEWLAFGDEVRAIRRGWQPTAATRLGVCRGTDRCEVPLGLHVDAVGEGPHVVTIELTPPPAPASAEVVVRYREVCRVQTLIEAQVSERLQPLTVEHRARRDDSGGPVTLVLHGLPAVSPDARRACGYFIEVTNPLTTDVHEGSYVVGLPEGRARAFDDALQPVAAAPEPEPAEDTDLAPPEHGPPPTPPEHGPPPAPPEGGPAPAPAEDGPAPAPPPDDAPPAP